MFKLCRAVNVLAVVMLAEPLLMQVAAQHPQELVTATNYRTDDGQQRSESRDGEGNVRGEYSYVDPNGKTIKVRYTAGKDGFKVEGDHLPVAPQPLPVQQQQQQQHQPQYNPQQSQYQPQQSHYQPQQPQYNPYQQQQQSAPQALQGLQNFPAIPQPQNGLFNPQPQQYNNPPQPQYNNYQPQQPQQYNAQPQYNPFQNQPQQGQGQPGQVSVSQTTGAGFMYTFNV